MSRIDAALRDLRSLDELAARDTPLARIDPRAKVLAVSASANMHQIGRCEHVGGCAAG